MTKTKEESLYVLYGSTNSVLLTKEDAIEWLEATLAMVRQQ